MQTHIHSILHRPNLGLLMANLILSRPQYNGATILSLLVLLMHNKFPNRQTNLLPGVGCFGLFRGSLLLAEPFRFAVCFGPFLVPTSTYWDDASSANWYKSYIALSETSAWARAQNQLTLAVETILHTKLA